MHRKHQSGGPALTPIFLVSAAAAAMSLDQPDPNLMGFFGLCCMRRPKMAMAPNQFLDGARPAGRLHALHADSPCAARARMRRGWLESSLEGGGG